MEFHDSSVYQNTRLFSLSFHYFFSSSILFLLTLNLVSFCNSYFDSLFILPTSFIFLSLSTIHSYSFFHWTFFISFPFSRTNTWLPFEWMVFYGFTPKLLPVISTCREISLVLFIFIERECFCYSIFTSIWKYSRLARSLSVLSTDSLWFCFC